MLVAEKITADAKENMRVCVLGAGTAGLCAARRAIQNNFDVTVYEQSDEVGGTWVYTDEIGVNKYGIDVHSSMYQGLRTNLPKEIMGYPDFEIKEHPDSYVPAAEVLKFLQDYADVFKIVDHIKFLHHVIRIHRQRNKWQVIVKNLSTGCYLEEVFDFIMICNGHYHTPMLPEIPGMDIFEGKIIHSHDYRCADAFKGESVLIIGAGPSGMDLCNEISKTAKRVILSHHLPEIPKTKFSNNVFQRPDVLKFHKKGSSFTDGSSDEFTTVIFCTGYKYSFPFLSVDCGITVDDNFVQPLYKHCLNIKNPTMALIGLPFYVCAAQMMDLQSRFVLKFWCGQKELPSQHEMFRDTNERMSQRWRKGLKKRQAHMMGNEQMEYYDDLAKTADIEPILPVMSKIHDESSQRFLDDLLNFRKDFFIIVNSEMFKIIQKERKIES